MRRQIVKIDGSIHSRGYESQRHLEFGPDIPRAAPLQSPNIFLASMARAINEVLAGVRSVDQLSRIVSEQVYESLRNRAAAGALARLKAGRKPIIQPTDVVKVRFQSPAVDVIESVVLLSNRQRAKAVTIRLESQNGSWRATNIGFL
jgi:hypothetical protein